MNDLSDSVNLLYYAKKVSLSLGVGLLTAAMVGSLEKLYQSKPSSMAIAGASAAAATYNGPLFGIAVGLLTAALTQYYRSNEKP